MTQQEQTDLDTMKAEVVREKTEFYDYCLHISRLTPEQLPHTGHKTIPDAFVSIFNSTTKSIKKLTDAYIRKYPD